MTQTPSLVPMSKPGSTLWEEHRKNWLAPAGSPQERRILKQLASNRYLSAQDRKMVQAWLDKPNGFEERNNMWFRMAKKKLLGEYVYDMAIARHQSLSPTQWHVAYLISAGYTQPEMVELLKVGLRTIQYTVEDIK